MRHDIPIPRPDPHSTPTPDRLATVLMVWTVGLILLVLAAVRDLPAVLVGLMLPYFALVVWHLLARSGPRPTRLQPLPVDPEGVHRSSASPEVDACPPTGGSDERVEASGSRESNPPAKGSPGSPRGNAGRVRGRRRGDPSPHAASAPVPWVQVGPGRYIRGESPDPTPDPPAEPSAVDVTVPNAPHVGQSPEAMSEEASCVPEAGDPPGDPGGAAGVEDGETASTDLRLDRSG